MVYFVNLTSHNGFDELNPSAVNYGQIDTDFLIKNSRVLDDYGYTHTLIPYGSSGADPFTIAATVLAVTKQLAVVIALRPNTIYPTVAAKALATLEHLGKGRVVVHFIAGGNDIEQKREGDYLSKDERYERQEEYIQILRKVWESDKPFDWNGKHYKFENFVANVRPNGKIPISVGGSSPEAYRVGGALADIFAFWGEPLKETKEQIEQVYAEAKKAGRTDVPVIWSSHRPIVAETDELAWARAHRTLDQLNENAKGTLAFNLPKKDGKDPEPQNVGSQRLLSIAKRGDVQDTALWLPTATATGARGNSTSLVGSYDTVAHALVEYTKIGVEYIMTRGYSNHPDAVLYGAELLPRVRALLKEQKE